MNTPYRCASSAATHSLATAVWLAVAWGTASAEAQLPAESQASVQGGAAVSVREAPGAELALDLRHRSADGLEVGGLVEVGLRDAAYVGGQTEHGASSGGVGLVLLVPLTRQGPLSLELRGVAGASYLRLLEAPRAGSRDAARARLEVGMLAHVRLETAWLLRLGATLGFELEVAPTIDLADQTALLCAGIAFAPSSDWMLHAQLEGGGSYGFDGDNGKVIVRGTVGVRVAFDGAEVLHAY